MSRPASIRQRVLVSLTLACLGATWWGCGAQPQQHPTTTSSSSSSVSSSASSGTGGTGGIGLDGGGGDGSVGDGGPDEAGVCTSTSAVAHHVPLDIVFLIDRSGSMDGPKWIGTTAALTKFFNDPASASISAGLVFLPRTAWDCVPSDYEALDVPISALPLNAFALTNAIPAHALGDGTPMYGALKGALMAATAYQDAHPTHKVVLVLATDGDPNGCQGQTIDEIAALAKSARDYNGVLTYVIGCVGSTIANLDKIAVAGGTTAAYDITMDINQFSAKIAEIRTAELGCDFAIPAPPNSQQLDPDKVNFSYTPKGMGTPKILLRSSDLAHCNNKPGWYYDSNAAPTKIVLCPASCATVQADSTAQVSVLFGCKSLIN